mmetsp:Transcript_28523/g.44608  ORF Transcript_28523/g.44608 Transcript_28523/m.44608 type:complete len:242 (-) Transcript_28523:375-1100(-)
MNPFTAAARNSNRPDSFPLRPIDPQRSNLLSTAPGSNGTPPQQHRTLGCTLQAGARGPTTPQPKANDAAKSSGNLTQNLLPEPQTQPNHQNTAEQHPSRQRIQSSRASPEALGRGGQKGADSGAWRANSSRLQDMCAHTERRCRKGSVLKQLCCCLAAAATTTLLVLHVCARCNPCDIKRLACGNYLGSPSVPPHPARSSYTMKPASNLDTTIPAKDARQARIGDVRDHKPHEPLYRSCPK